MKTASWTLWAVVILCVSTAAVGARYGPLSTDVSEIYPRTPGHYHGPVAAPTSDASSGLQTLVLVAFCLGGLGILGGVIFTTVICYRHFRDRARSRARDAARALDAARDILDHVQLQGLPSGRAPHTQEAIIVQQPGGGVSQS
ncbi:uncharacterized protein LOC113328158 [Papaver somniferum]|uniref:uncharacterized protein LOC113328158 n=1 Tax=Papaver somniferum TaxID=3469 RepID=UPI000E6FD7AC|nr:uncharacterized protein LOC113328158 [Papaver somniferum]XP_026431029.1 uncharacterized protein LOC113328158 [Papaver somniferum]